MAVLVEAISVIVLRAAIDACFPGGWSAFQSIVPNRTFCFDSKIARVGFMSAPEVTVFIDQLESAGLRFLVNDEAQDIAVVDQLTGPTTRAAWLEATRINANDTGGRVTACRFPAELDEEVVTPEGWVFEGSLSDKPNFTSDEEFRMNMEFVRSNGGLDVYLDKRTGKEVFVGRTSRTH